LLVFKKIINKNFFTRKNTGRTFAPLDPLPQLKHMIQLTNFKMCRSSVFPVVLNGYETWSLAGKERHKLWKSENGVLREVSG
jgi:hypothetical protein